MSRVFVAIAGFTGIRHAMISDVTENGFTFTDGCGFMSTSFAKIVSKNRNFMLNSQRFIPSVVQLRFRYLQALQLLSMKLA